MSNIDKELKRSILANWYECLPANLQAQLRTNLMEKCQMSKSAFYNYLHGRREIPNYLYVTGIVPFISQHKYEYSKATPQTVEVEK